MPTPDFWRDVFWPALWNSANPFNKSIGELVYSVAFVVIAVLSLIKIYREHGLNNEKIRRAILSFAILGLAWVGLFIFNLLSIPFTKWKDTNEQLTTANNRLATANADVQPSSQLARTNNKVGKETPKTTQTEQVRQPNSQSTHAEQRSSGANSPNILGNNTS